MKWLVIAALSLGVLWIGNAWLDPAPLSSATGIAGGLAGLAVGSRKQRGAAVTGAVVGLVAGLALGVGGHGYVHASGGSPEPEEGLLRHFGSDALRGAAVAVPAQLFAFAIARPKATR